MEGVGGRWSQALLRLYAFWEFKFQNCVIGSCDVWSSFFYILYSYQHIQHSALIKFYNMKLKNVGSFPRLLAVGLFAHWILADY
jgi:hypothetical protein